MALTKRKKKAAPIRRRTGMAGAPIEKGFPSVQDYFQMEVSRKDAIEQLRTFIKNRFNKTEAKYILALPDWKYFGSHYQCATAFWYNTGLEESEKSQYWLNAVMQRLTGFIEEGKAVYQQKQREKQDDVKVVTLSPQQRLLQKINNTIMIDIDDLEDKWIAGEKASIDVYGLFRKHGLSGSATLPVRQTIEGWLLDYEDAYHKRCKDAVEGYSHLKRPELNRRIKECKAMLDDLDRIKSVAKATRKVRIAKPQSIDKQVAKVKYRKDDKEFKIASVNPALVIGKHKLYVFNVKYRRLTEYVTHDPKGFIIKGTTIQNFDKATSRTLTLRKPMDILPKATTCTPRQLTKLLDEIKTKPSVPNGRLNEDTVLLRVEK